MHVQGKSPVKVQLKILDVSFLRKLHTVYMVWGEALSSCGGCDMG
jgi:hypothetical protein